MKKHWPVLLALLLTLAMTLSACQSGAPSDAHDVLASGPEQADVPEQEGAEASVPERLTVQYAAEASKSLYASVWETLLLRSDGRVIQLRQAADPGELMPRSRDIADISGGVSLRADGTIMDINDVELEDILTWTDITSVSRSMSYVLGLRSDGTVLVEALDEDTAGWSGASAWTGIRAVSAGWNHAAGLRADGTVVTAGRNDSGQCDVSDWTNIVAVSAGYGCTIGLKADGTVVAAGLNDFGQCDVSGWTDIVAISASSGTGKYTVGLRADGTVVATGQNSCGQCDVSDWTGIIAVAAGDDHTVGLRADGTAVAAGANDHHQCDVAMVSDIKVPGDNSGTEPPHEPGPLTVETAKCTSLAGSTWYTIGLRSDGTVLATGINDDGRADVSGWTGIVAVAASFHHAVGLRADGTVVAAGDFGASLVDLVSQWTGITAITAGLEQVVGLRADGTVVAAGGNDYGQCNVSDWTGIVSVAAGYEHTVGLRADGTVVAVGNNEQGQCEVSGWTDIVAVAAGQYHTVGLRSDGTVVATAINDRTYDWLQSYVGNWTDIMAISADYEHTVGLRSDGTVVAVGWEAYGQCDVEDWTDIVGVVAGGNYTLGLKKDGTVVAAGYNGDGQCSVSGWTDIQLPYAGELPGWTDAGLSAEPTASPVPEAPADEQQLRCAYAAYLSFLQENQGTIGQYNWQTIWQDGQCFSDGSKTVALTDITGDGIPELIYMQPGPNTLVTLHIATFRDGGLVWLYSDDSTYWDGQVGGGFSYYLFKVAGDTALYGYLHPTFESEGHIGYSRFAATADGTLTRVPVCEQVIRAEYDESGYRETVTYQVDGAETSQDGYLAKEEEIRSNITEFFQNSFSAGEGEDLSRRFDMQSLGRAMTCEEAMAYLRAQSGSGASPVQDAAAAPGLFAQIPSEFSVYNDYRKAKTNVFAAKRHVWQQMIQGSFARCSLQ